MSFYKIGFFLKYAYINTCLHAESMERAEVSILVRHRSQ